MADRQVHLIATTAFGIESVVKDEVRKLGYTIDRVENGRVYYTGDVRAIARSNLWLRCADRVLLQIGRFYAKTFDELFEKTKALPWEDWIPKKANFLQLK